MKKRFSKGDRDGERIPIDLKEQPAFKYFEM